MVAEPQTFFLPSSAFYDLLIISHLLFLIFCLLRFHLLSSILFLLPFIIHLRSSIFYCLASFFYFLSSCIIHLSSSMFYLLFSIFYLLSSIFCLLSSISYLPSSFLNHATSTIIPCSLDAGASDTINVSKHLFSENVALCITLAVHDFGVGQ